MHLTQKPKPFSFKTIFFISFFFSCPPGIFLIGLNWKRLGKNNKAILAISLSIILAILLLTIFYYEFLTDKNPTNLNSIIGSIPILNIFIILIAGLFQKKDIENYLRENKEIKNRFATPRVGVLIGFIWTLIVLISLIIFSGLPIKNFFLVEYIAESQEYKDYMNAAESDDMMYDKKAELMKPFYEKYKKDDYLGAETSLIYGVSTLWAGNLEEGKKVIDFAYQEYSNNKEYGKEIIEVRKSMPLWENIEEHNEYENAVNNLLNKDLPEKALPIILNYHNKYKDIPFLNGETYYNLTVAYLQLDQDDNAMITLEEGIKKFPNNEDLQKIYDSTIPI